MSFKIGDKVVCIAGGKLVPNPELFCETPRETTIGEIYCVADFNESPYVAGDPLRLFLVGYQQIYLPAKTDVGFRPSRFRLLHRCKEKQSASFEANQPNVGNRD